MNITTKTLFAALTAAVAAAAMSAPATAQPYGRGSDRQDPQGRYEQDDRGYDRGERYDDRGAYNLNQRQERLMLRIEHGVRNGSLNRREAYRLRDSAWQIARIEARYRVNGLSNWERADLDRRFDNLDQQIRHERRDRDYGYGYGLEGRR